jgi:tRNA A37 threonylcarbamoyladenosine biosynthesis protein TsaE
MLVEWGEAYRRELPSAEAVDIRIAVEGDERVIAINGLTRD